eukprot:Gregarina_sp_Pseudo_9__54@NODE_1036_length_1949_cov_14_618848_g971_i0_p1_GENE_NODE_1036_length_1949_cov_14_618848_g971_i0NODE_1036_length_1949_cov_14_618848_g971_i0_p1_ORF_typecomplete_len632_score131_24Scs3p/PF10261_9/0_00043DUF3040/PF11239_8/5_5DUF3040/PF11239_8/12DUF2417/PF10329_9/5_4DUF2417/PF10329_9/58WTF/PF03303_13/1_9e03WTF/PF03303_13/1_6e04WTF/PF03303_13/1_6_NODE_1036_length_1949_cov_14_618848_g971_i0461941
MISKPEPLSFGGRAPAQSPKQELSEGRSERSLSSSTQVNAHSTPVVAGEEESPPGDFSSFYSDSGGVVKARSAERQRSYLTEPDELLAQAQRGPALFYESVFATSQSHPPSPAGLLCSSTEDEARAHFFKPHPASSHYRDNSANSCMTDATVGKVLDEGQDSPATHAVSPRAAVSAAGWPRAWRLLLRFQAVVILLLLVATLLGSTFAGVKWSYVSPKLHGVSVWHLRDAIAGSTVSRPDFQFARAMLFSPIHSLTDPHWTAPGSDVYAMSEDLQLAPFSVFIPSPEKRDFRRHRQEDTSYPPNFSMALVCSEFTPDIEAADYPWTYTAFTCPQAFTFNSEMKQVLQPVSTPPSSNIPHMAKVDASALGFGRRCVLWSDGSRTLRAVDMPRIINGTRGIFSPNYPGEALIHGVLRDPLWMALIILLVWSHSLFTAQSWTGVHLPRLAFYAGIGVYRWLVLYLGLGEIEKFDQIQTLMRTADAAFKISSTFTRSPADFFDFSDHLVATFACLFILSTELFCLFEFSLQASPDSIPTLASPQSGESQSVSLPGTPGQFERPWKLPRPLLFCWTGVVMVLICALIYAGFATAAFFHSPLESLIGYAIGFVGIWGVFWVLLFFDYLIRSIWFWHD